MTATMIEQVAPRRAQGPRPRRHVQCQNDRPGPETPPTRRSQHSNAQLRTSRGRRGEPAQSRGKRKQHMLAAGRPLLPAASTGRRGPTYRPSPGQDRSYGRVATRGPMPTPDQPRSTTATRPVTHVRQCNLPKAPHAAVRRHHPRSPKSQPG